MPRNMSVAFTEQAVRDRLKIVTRRKGWVFLKPGDRLSLVRKSMGRKPGEPLVRVAEVEVVTVRRERLAELFCVHQDFGADYAAKEMAREGFPGLDPVQFVRTYFIEAQKVHAHDYVTRIEWRYLTPQEGGEIL